jgi:hypothetical protein
MIFYSLNAKKYFPACRMGSSQKEASRRIFPAETAHPLRPSDTL